MAQQQLLERVNKQSLIKAFALMYTSKVLSDLFNENRQICYYVHANSRGHEAIQLATAMQLKAADWVSLYYRDDAFLLGMGWKPEEILMQLIAKKADPFSGGRSYYCHPSYRGPDKPQMIHQSSATGMQAIPSTGIAQGIKYMTQQGLLDSAADNPVVVCSIGDSAVTEGEVAEALQFAALHQLPIIYLIQDNDWGISVTSTESRAMNAYEYAAGFKGLKRVQVNGSDFVECWQTMQSVIGHVRVNRSPVLVHAKVPLLNHHTSGVRMEMYRPEKDIEEHRTRDPLPILRETLLEYGISNDELETIQGEIENTTRQAFHKAIEAEEPDSSTLEQHVFAPASITEEQGVREPQGAEPIIMVDAALHAMQDILEKHPEALFYGQDVGGRLGGVFREAANLAQKYGRHRVFNTPIQEAYIVGSTAGMSAVGAVPIVEIQFADYLWPAMNQLVCEISKSCYLTNGKWPVNNIVRIPIGAYGSGGPYHSGSFESVLTALKGIKVVYPSNAADMKGLLKGAFYDPNPIIIFEHKGLYWSKVPGTQAAKCPEPDKDYIVPIGKARIYQSADAEKIQAGETCVVISYGMGIHWALNASRKFPGRVEILDLRTLSPYDWQAIEQSVMRHNKCFVLTEEPLMNSFAQALAGRIGSECFKYLDAPVQLLGSKNLPAVPLNSGLEKAMIPNAQLVEETIEALLNW